MTAIRTPLPVEPGDFQVCSACTRFAVFAFSTVFGLIRDTFTTSDRDDSACTPARSVLTAKPGTRLVVVYSLAAFGSALRAAANARLALLLITERWLRTLLDTVRPATLPASTAPWPWSCTK